MGIGRTMEIALKNYLMIGAVMALAGCQYFDAVVDTTTGAAATVVDRACEGGMTPTAMALRMDTVDEINSKTEIGNHTPSDCDGDGVGDFMIGEDGMVLR